MWEMGKCGLALARGAGLCGEAGTWGRLRDFEPSRHGLR